MTTERAIRILAGTMVLLSLVLATFVSKWGCALAGFVALNLIQSSFTGVCPAEGIFRRLGIPDGAACGASTRSTTSHERYQA